MVVIINQILLQKLVDLVEAAVTIINQVDQETHLLVLLLKETMVEMVISI